MHRKIRKTVKHKKINDIIFVGGGISSLYTAYLLQKEHKKNKKHNSFSFQIFEKNKRLGGRLGIYSFHQTDVVMGAGVIRAKKDHFLIKLTKELKIKINPFKTLIQPYKRKSDQKIVSLKNYFSKLRAFYKKLNFKQKRHFNFQKFFLHFFSKNEYKEFKIAMGYTDYKYDEILEVLNHYGLDDNNSGWDGYSVNWTELINKISKKIKRSNIHLNEEVKQIDYNKSTQIYSVKTNHNRIYYAKKIVIGTNADHLKKLIKKSPNLKKQFPILNKIFNNIHGQTFLRLYALFDKSSNKILENKVNGTTLVEGPLHKIIPIDKKKGIYMIAYTDNEDAHQLRSHLKNTEKNRKYLSHLVSKSLGINGSKSLGINAELKIKDIKAFYWPTGTHYYSPLGDQPYKDITTYVRKAQNPIDGFFVVGEMISRQQGWTQGALESVHSVFDKIKR